MRCIIFGGDGFLGHHTARALASQGVEVIVCDRRYDHAPELSSVHFEHIDIRNAEEVHRFHFSSDDVVVNVAAVQYHEKIPKTHRDEFFQQTNCRGTKNILEAMEKQGCRKFIYYSTDMVYGKPQYLPVDTRHPQVPFGPYGESKKISEGICRAFREKGFHITIFRPRLIIGPGRLGILEKLFWLVEHHLPVLMIGKGNNCYQMISVFDCVQAITCALRHDIPNREYNLGSKNPPTVRALLRSLIVERKSHSSLIATNGSAVKSTLAFLGKIGIDIMHKEQYMIADEQYIVDTSATEHELGWMPEYSDQQMLKEAYEYYLQKHHPA